MVVRQPFLWFVWRRFAQIRTGYTQDSRGRPVMDAPTRPALRCLFLFFTAPLLLAAVRQFAVLFVVFRGDAGRAVAAAAGCAVEEAADVVDEVGNGDDDDDGDDDGCRTHNLFPL